MKKRNYNRGREIHYDHVPDDVYETIIHTQAQIKISSKRSKVSMSEAITKLVRMVKKIESGFSG
jgi:hypothetical protein